MIWLRSEINSDKLTLSLVTIKPLISRTDIFTVRNVTSEIKEYSELFN